MGKITLAALFFLFVWSVNAQTNYYVDQVNGDDNYNGTSLQTPWRTIQKACNTAVANSIVQIKAGVYHENITVGISGTFDNRILIKNYLNDVVIIDGTGTSQTTLLRITDKSYLTFENLTFQNLIMNNAKGILIETPTGSSSGLTFRNLKIKNIKWTPNNTDIPSSGTNAQSFIAYGGNGGITDLLIDGCEISDNILGYSEALTLSGNVSGFTIKNCLIHDNNNIGIDLAGNYGVCTNPLNDHARNGVVRNNICYNNISPYATAAGIYVDGGQDISIEKNTSFANGTGIEVGCENNGTTIYVTAKNNIIYNNLTCGIAVGGYSTLNNGQVLACTFRNNTIFQNNSSNSGTGEISITKASNCVFEDNIFYTTSQNVFMTLENVVPQNGNLFNYNCWFTPSGNSDNIIVHWKASTYSTYSAYKTATLQEQNSIYQNPGLLSTTASSLNLHLGGSSICINEGNPVLAISSGETDFDGNPRISSGIVDIGAQEFQGILGMPSNGSRPTGAYPNPFTTETTISSAAEFQHADLYLYDVTGKIVKEIKNISGNEVLLSKGSLIPGLYFYRIFENNKTLIQGKVIID